MLNRKLGIVDLSKEKTSIQEVPNSLRKAYLGGRGLNIHYLYKMMRGKEDAFGPNNVLIFGAGFLTGTLAPSSGRFNVSAKSPESGIFGDCNCGGFFAPEMRYAGFDRIILKGKAKKPVYIYANDGDLEIRDAGDYWGMDTYEVQQAMKKDLGPCEMAVCGTAGESMVRMACIRTGVKNAGGRGGMGGVMGSKKVKAIVASGSLGIQLDDPERMLKLVERIKGELLSTKIAPILGTVGTPLLYEVSNAFGGIRTKNSQLNAWSDSLKASEVEKYVEKMIACSSCFMHCRHRNTLGGEGPEYTALGLVGANIGIEKLAHVIELQNECNRLGIDISSAGTVLAWAYELYERGIIDDRMTGGLKLRFGDFELSRNLLNMIAKRQGFGNILAESTRAEKYFGEKSKDYIIAVKHLPQSDPHDVRYMKAFALGIATSSRGADHLRSRPTLEIFFKLPFDVKEKIYGKGINPDPTSYEGKANVVFFSQNIFATIDTLGICKFICHGFNSPHFLNYSHFRELIDAAAGWKYTEEQLRQVGMRVIDTERLFNCREGISRKDDSLPKRYFDDPAPLKVAKGHHIDRQKFQNMLDDYYKLCGWTQDGKVKPARKKQLEAIA